jgi:hypothetical protein
MHPPCALYLLPYTKYLDITKVSSSINLAAFQASGWADT